MDFFGFHKMMDFRVFDLVYFKSPPGLKWLTKLVYSYQNHHCRYSCGLQTWHTHKKDGRKNNEKNKNNKNRKKERKQKEKNKTQTTQVDTVHTFTLLDTEGEETKSQKHRTGVKSIEEP